jgi:hypothetical protein
MTIRRKMAAVLACGIVAAGVAAPALADDLLLSKNDATPLIDSNVGKPYWQMEAQCAGMFGAAYAYNVDRRQKAEAEQSKDTGISMLNEAVARLEMDRGLDQPTALNLAAPEVEVGRESARVALERQGTGPATYFNWIKSACYDISEAQRRHARR